MSETIKAREKGPITHTLTNNFQSLCPKSTFVLKAMDKKSSEKDDSHIQAFIKMVVYTGVGHDLVLSRFVYDPTYEFHSKQSYIYIHRPEIVHVLAIS